MALAEMKALREQELDCWERFEFSLETSQRLMAAMEQVAGLISASGSCGTRSPETR